MKHLIDKINESTENLSALYLKGEQDTWTIDATSKFNCNGVTVAWDPHAGIYFIGKENILKELQKAISEETIIEKDCI